MARRAIFDALPQGGADATQGGPHPGLALPEGLRDFARGFGKGVLVLEKPALLGGQLFEALLQNRREGQIGGEFAPPGLLNEVVFEELLPVFRKALMPQGFLAHEIEGDRPQPLAEIGTRLEIHDVAVGKDEGLVGDLVDEVGDGQFHRDEGAKVRAVQLEEPLEGGKIPVLHADDEFVLCFLFIHCRVYPGCPPS